MNDRDALYAAILAHPDEDTPRLAFADYLEENGEGEYAAFIRKQVELAKVPEWDPLWIRAWHQDRDAVTGRGFTAFQPPLAPGLRWPTLETFRRGFPWHVASVESEPFLASAEQLFRTIPLQALTISADYDKYRDPINLSALFRSPHLAPIRQLTFPLTRFTPGTAKELRDSPHLTNLRELRFQFATLDVGVMRELLQPPLVERLESLEVRGTVVDDLVAGIVNAGGPHRLRRFRHGSFNQGSFGNFQTFDSPFLSTLGEFDLSKCDMSADQMRALCRSPVVRELESLTLLRAFPGVPGVKALAECESLKGLKRLRLGGNRLGPVALKALAQSPHMGSLQALDLTDNKLGDKGAMELTKAPWLKNLVSLGLMHCAIGDAGAEALCDALDPAKLVHLELFSSISRTKISDRVRQKFRDKFSGDLSM